MQSSRSRFFQQANEPPALVNPAQRPAYLTEAIQNDFDKVIESSGMGYLFVGELISGYHFPVSGYLRIDSDEVIAHAIQAHSSIVVCDIGAGAFGFEKNNKLLFGDNVKNYGITATNFGSLQANNRVVGKNAEYLSQVFGVNRFDFCFSRLTFVHLVDSVGSLIEAYKTLKTGGMLIVDYFYLSGCNKYIPHLIPYLTSQGYLVSGHAHIGYTDQLQSFIIKKTANKPELTMPFLYGELNDIKSRVSYSPTPEFKLYCLRNKKSLLREYQAGCQLLTDSLRDNERLRVVIEDCVDIVDLFSHPHYALLEKRERYQAILTVVAKSVESVNAICALSAERAEVCVPYHTFYRKLHDSINSTEFYSGLCVLSRDGAFRQLSIEDQKLLIEHHAAMDVIKLYQAKKIENALRKMGIPFKRTDIDSTYKDPNELSYSSLNRRGVSGQKITFAV